MEKIKRETDPAKVGMILCHNGVVRGTSRDGEAVASLEVFADQEVWDAVLREMRTRTGIAAVEAVIFTGRRRVGEDIMLVAVAGDIRENVFPVLEMIVNRLKREAVRKVEDKIVPPCPGADP